MILTNEAILKAHAQGKIVIDPFDKRLVSVNSVDIRLGRECWVLNSSANGTQNGMRDLYRDQTPFWESLEPIKAKSIREKNPEWNGEGIDDNHDIFVFMPGKFYLATTFEKIGTSQGSDLVAEMKSKSTFGRNGLSTALCAGLGDIGYVSKWALEVRIINDTCPIPVAVGTPIGQVVFHTTTKEKLWYGGSSRYQDDKGVRFIPKAMPLPIVG